MDPAPKPQTPEEERERALVGEKRSYAQYEGMFGEEDGGLRTPLSRDVKEHDIFEKGRKQTGKSGIGVKIGNRQMRPAVLANLPHGTGIVLIFSADFLADKSLSWAILFIIYIHPNSRFCMYIYLQCVALGSIWKICTP